MPFKDNEGNTVEQGEKADFSRTATVSTDGAGTLVLVPELTTITEASADYVNPANVAAADGINAVSVVSGADNEVGVTLLSTATGSLDVRVDATGY